MGRIEISPSRLVLAPQRSKAEEPTKPARIRYIPGEQDGASERSTCCVECLRALIAELEDARLVKEDTLCQESWPESRKQHVRAVRSRLAAHWNLDTRLSEVDFAHYAA
jgi:hypothetical protein